jgi:hypothetical protein
MKLLWLRLVNWRSARWLRSWGGGHLNVDAMSPLKVTNRTNFTPGADSFLLASLQF